MKKFILLVLALALVCSAFAEEFTPAMFLGSRGLMVMDEKQMESMGGGFDSENDKANDYLHNVDMVVFSNGNGENSAPGIFFTDDGVMYMAFDMTAMFGGGMLDAKGMSQIFIDLCNAYDFEVYMCSIGETDYTYAKDPDSLIESMGVSEADIAKAELIETKDEFIDTVKAAFK